MWYSSADPPETDPASDETASDETADTETADTETAGAETASDETADAGTARIRCACVEDHDALIEVHRAAIEQLCAGYYTPGQIRHWAVPRGLPPFDEVIHRTFVLVAETGDRIDGFAQMDPLTGIVQAVIVHPDRVRGGLGTRLLRMLEAAAREHGHRTISLDSTRNAIGFYERLGYTRGDDAWTELADGTRIESVKMTKPLLGPAKA